MSNFLFFINRGRSKYFWITKIFDFMFWFCRDGCGDAVVAFDNSSSLQIGAVSTIEDFLLLSRDLYNFSFSLSRSYYFFDRLAPSGYVMALVRASSVLYGIGRLLSIYSLMSE